MVLEGFADAIRSGGIHQQAHRQHHQQSHDPLGCFEIERRSQNARIFEEPEAAFGVLLALIAVKQQLGWSLGVVELVRGEDETTLLGYKCLMGSARRG